LKKVRNHISHDYPEEDIDKIEKLQFVWYLYKKRHYKEWSYRF